MVQIVGYYCSICRRRYVAHVCKTELPCLHHGAEIRGHYILAPATIIRSYAWRYKEGFKEFELQEVYFKYNEETEKSEKQYTKTVFSAKYKTGEELRELFLKFLQEKVRFMQWPIWVNAFVSLFSGGSSAQFAPNWRWKQIVRMRGAEQNEGKM